MANEYNEVTEQALRLSLSERVALAERLWDSVEDGLSCVEPDSEEVRLAATEARRRGAEMSSGAVEGVPHEEVMAKLRKTAQ